MNNSSLFQGALLGVFTLAALIGLFVFASHSNQSQTGLDAKVVIWGTLPGEKVGSLLTSLVSIDTSFKNVSYVEKPSSVLSGDLARAIATGEPPDLILASHEDLFSIERLVLSLSTDIVPPATFNATFPQATQIFALPDGSGYYGLPFLIDPLVLYANQNLLASAGITRAPTTWEGLTGLTSSSLVSLSSTRQVSRVLIPLGTYDNVDHARGILSALFLQVGVPVVRYTNGGYVPDLEGAGKNGDAVVDFYTQFADPSKVSYTWNASLPSAQRSFLSGQAAFYLGYGSERDFLKSANPNVAVALSPLPQPKQKVDAGVKTAYGLFLSLIHI